MKIPPVLSVFAVVLCAIESDAQSITIWNTFQEPGNNYYGYRGPALIGTGVNPPAYDADAEAFVPSASGYLDTLSLAASAFNSGPANLNIYVEANNNNLPGNVLESFLNVPCSTIYNNLSTIITLNSALNPYLNAGVTYWVEVQPASPDLNGAWDYALPSSTYKTLERFN